MTQAATISGDAVEHRRAEEVFAAIAKMSQDKAGVSRPAFSVTETATLHYLEDVAVQAGLATSYDAGQNLVMTLPEDAEAEKFVLVGSHVDSVSHLPCPGPDARCALRPTG